MIEYLQISYMFFALNGKDFGIEGDRNRDLITSRSSGLTSSGNSSGGFDNNSYGYFVTVVRFRIFCF